MSSREEQRIKRLLTQPPSIVKLVKDFYDYSDDNMPKSMRIDTPYFDELKSRYTDTVFDRTGKILLGFRNEWVYEKEWFTNKGAWKNKNKKKENPLGQVSSIEMDGLLRIFYLGPKPADGDYPQGMLDINGLLEISNYKHPETYYKYGNFASAILYHRIYHLDENRMKWVPITLRPEDREYLNIHALTIDEINMKEYNQIVARHQKNQIEQIRPSAPKPSTSLALASKRTTPSASERTEPVVGFHTPPANEPRPRQLKTSEISARLAANKEEAEKSLVNAAYAKILPRKQKNIAVRTSIMSPFATYFNAPHFASHFNASPSAPYWPNNTPNPYNNATKKAANNVRAKMAAVNIDLTGNPESPYRPYNAVSPPRPFNAAVNIDLTGNPESVTGSPPKSPNAVKYIDGSGNPVNIDLTGGRRKTRTSKKRTARRPRADSKRPSTLKRSRR